MSEENISVVALQALCDEVTEKRKFVEAAKDVYTKLDEELHELEMKLVDIMSSLDMKSFNKGGFRFTRVEKYSINTPKGEDKETFFAYLKSIGHFDALATVHSNTLNSWYKQEDAAAKERGEPYAMIPGLDMPTARISLSVTKTPQG